MHLKLCLSRQNQLPLEVTDTEYLKKTIICFLKLKISDRKSTRLNSSHSLISYAVFCLKKKNIHDEVLTGYYNQASTLESLLQTPVKLAVWRVTHYRQGCRWLDGATVLTRVSVLLRVRA